MLLNPQIKDLPGLKHQITMDFRTVVSTVVMKLLYLTRIQILSMQELSQEDLGCLLSCLMCHMMPEIRGTTLKKAIRETQNTLMIIG